MAYLILTAFFYISPSILIPEMTQLYIEISQHQKPVRIKATKFKKKVI